MKSLGRPAFTLIELMAVILIIGLLMLLLYPTMAGLMQTVRLTECSNHLHHIHQAFYARAADARASPDQLRPFRAGSWKGALLPYLEFQTSELTCPLADPEPGQPDIEIYQPPTITRSAPAPGPATSTGPQMRSIEDLNVEVWLSYNFRGVAAGNKIYDMDSEEGPWAKKYPAGSRNPNGAIVHDGTYELWYEDSWNVTWNDVGLRFQEMPDKSIAISYVGENTAGNWYNLVDTMTDEVLLRGMGDGVWHGPNEPREPPLPIGSTVRLAPEGSDGTPAPAAPAPTPTSVVAPEPQTYSMAAGLGNYGMNSLADQRDFLPGHVILFLDYKKTVARGPTTGNADDWRRTGWQTAEGIPVFARHFGMINVLFSDGSIELVDPRDVEPLRGDIATDKYWDPNATR